MKECNKKCFDSLREANNRIREIRTEDKISETKPIRAYRCQACRRYHITSMNMSQFDKHKKVLNQRHQERYNEVSFWCKKLGVNNRGEEISKIGRLCTKSHTTAGKGRGRPSPYL